MAVAGLVWAAGLSAPGQIDPQRRELIQLGYNQPIEGASPLAAYGFYLLNRPQFLDRSNLILRLAVAPVYVDGELGFRGLLGPQTDLGLGVAGGGFADSYTEIRQGTYHKAESFFGSGGSLSASVYHRFNPQGRIPIHGIVRASLHGTVYSDMDHTADNFQLPPDQLWSRVRAGLRWGGREPVLMTDVAMELSAWVESDFRTEPGCYGFGGDRRLEPNVQRFIARALFTYTLAETKHQFSLNCTGGTSWNADRLGAFRLGGYLPLSSELPLGLPGYFFHELSAESFVLLCGAYSLPLGRHQRWRLGATASSAHVDYLPGFDQTRPWNTGVAGTLTYRSPTDSWQIALAYGYGFDAMRSHGYGAQSVAVLLQFDLGRTRERFYDWSLDPDRARGFQGIFQTLFR
jgi:hypothetical protein